MDKRTVVVLCEDNYEEMELWYPVYRLKEAGYRVWIVGTGKEAYQGKHGYPAQTDKSIDEVDPETIDGVIIPGGYAPDRLRRNENVLDLVRKADARGAVVASICHGPWVLVSADVLRGRKLTCFSSIRDDVTNAGGIFENSEVVQDGNLITSRTPDDLPAFMKAVLGALPAL